MEIYKDSIGPLSSINPIKIEQKMALIEVINKRLLHSVYLTDKNQTEEGLKLNSYKLAKLQNHMENFDVSIQPSQNDIHNFASDLTIMLKNPPASLMDYFINNKTAKMNVSLIKMLQEDLLLIGLKGVIDRIPDKNHETDFKQAKLIIKTYFQHKIWKSSILSYDLPWLEKVNIPESMLEKIIINGLESHDQELITYFKNQNMIDHYERFRKVFKPIAFSATFYFYFEKHQTVVEKTKEESIKKIIFFKNLSQDMLH